MSPDSAWEQKLNTCSLIHVNNAPSCSSLRGFNMVHVHHQMVLIEPRCSALTSLIVNGGLGGGRDGEESKRAFVLERQGGRGDKL